MEDVFWISYFVVLLLLIGVSGYVQCEVVRPFLWSRGRKLVPSIFMGPHEVGYAIEAWKIASAEGVVPLSMKVGAAANIGILFLLIGFVVSALFV